MQLEPRSDKFVFIGYPRDTIRYTFYNKAEGTIFVSWNGVFLKKDYLSKEFSGRMVSLDEILSQTDDHYKVNSFLVGHDVLIYKNLILSKVLSLCINRFELMESMAHGEEGA